MNIAEIQKSTEQKMQKSLEALKHDYAKVRTGRAHVGLLDHITVDYYGTMVPLSQVAQVGLGDARTITVQPWEKKMVPVVEKAIRDSDLGLNPATSGDVVRVPMPPLTEQRRKELVKVVKHEGENAKVAVCNLRRDANHHVKELLKAKEVSEDEDRRGVRRSTGDRRDLTEERGARCVDEQHEAGEQRQSTGRGDHERATRCGARHRVGVLEPDEQERRDRGQFPEDEQRPHRVHPHQTDHRRRERQQRGGEPADAQGAR